MLNLQLCEIDPLFVEEMPLHSSIEEIVEGQGLAGVYENGKLVIKPSTATANELFVGFGLTRLEYPTKELVVEELQAVGTTLTLSYTPVGAATDMALYASDGELIAYAASGADGKFTVSGKTVTLHSDESDELMTAVYKRAITVEEAMRKYRHSVEMASQQAAAITRTVSVVRRGVIATDQIIAADNWGAFTAASQIVSTASGLLTLQSVDGGAVQGKPRLIPSAANPWLAIEFDATQI